MLRRIATSAVRSFVHPLARSSIIHSSVPIRCIAATPVRSSDLISSALDEVLEEERKDKKDKATEDVEGEETTVDRGGASNKKQEFAKATKWNAKGSRWRFRRIAAAIRGLPYEDAMLSLNAMTLRKKARTVRRILGAAKAAADHNYGLDTSKLYIDSIYVTKGEHLQGSIRFHSRGRFGRVSKPRTNIFASVKEMSDEWVHRRSQLQLREELWQKHIETKRAEFDAIYPAEIIFANTRSEADPHYKTLK